MVAYNINNHATELCIYELLSKVMQLVRLCVCHFFIATRIFVRKIAGRIIHKYDVANYSRHLTVKCQMLERERRYLILKYQMVGLRKDCERKKRHLSLECPM